MLEVIKTLETQDHIPAKQYRDLLPEKQGKGKNKTGKILNILTIALKKIYLVVGY